MKLKRHLANHFDIDAEVIAFYKKTFSLVAPRKWNSISWEIHLALP